MKLREGFTLIELLVVIAIIAIIAAIVFVSLDPVTRFAEARNSRRWEDVNAILMAINQYTVDNDGVLPTGITTSINQLGTCSSGGGTACSEAEAACLNLATALAPYLKSIPQDPSGGSASTTKYSVIKDANNIVVVEACNAELGVTIRAPAHY